MNDAFVPAAPAAVAEDGFTRAICEKLAAVRYGDLPAEIAQSVKLYLLDSFGVIAAGANAPGIAALEGRLQRWAGAGRASVLNAGFKTAPPDAALANGAAAHARDFDDQYDPARVHAYCVVLPAALAAAEEAGGVSGRDFIAAVATAVEFFARAGMACADFLGEGWHPTTSLGTLAGALAAGKVMGLDSDKLLNALGLAYHQMSGTTQVIADNALAKRLGPGFAARSGVLAAFLAGDGLTGPARALEGAAGLFALYARGQAQPHFLTDGLGEKWLIGRMSMKPYPCCRCTHAAIDLALALREEGIGAEEIEAGEILMGAVDVGIVGAPFAPEASPNPVVHGQFNAAYTVARALADGKVDLDAFRAERVLEPAVGGLARRLVTRADPAIEPNDIAGKAIRLTLRDGRQIERRRTVIKGSPEDPMREAEVLAKFRDCLAYGLGAGAAAADAFAEGVLDLDRADDAGALAARFPRRA